MQRGKSISAFLTDHCTQPHLSASKLLMHLDKEGTPAPLGIVMTERGYLNGHFGHGGDEPSWVYTESILDRRQRGGKG